MESHSKSFIYKTLILGMKFCFNVVPYTDICPNVSKVKNISIREITNWQWYNKIMMLSL